MKPVRILFWFYSRFYSFRQWRTRHVSKTGIMVLTAFFVSLLFAGNMSKSLIYQAVVLFLLILITGAVGSLIPFRPLIRVKRYIPEYGSAQSQLVYEIEIENMSDRIEKGLVLFEEILDPRPSFETFAATREPHEKRRNAWDRNTRYYRWLWLIRKKAKTLFRPVSLPDLIPGKKVIIKNGSFMQYRGYLGFQGVSIGRPDTLGLFNRVKFVARPDKVLILPKIDPVEPLYLKSSRHYHPGGINLASSIGNSDEFMALRDYRPGDPMRNIHWKSAAKTSQLVIREFEDEHFVRNALVLDTFADADNEDAFEAAVRLAASYVCQLQGPEAILDLLFAGRKVFSFTAGRGTGQVGKMLEVLACVEASSHKSIRELIPVLHRNMEQVSGGVCIFLDWDGDRKDIYKMFCRADAGIKVLIVSDDPKAIQKKVAEDIENPEMIAVTGI